MVNFEDTKDQKFKFEVDEIGYENLSHKSLSPKSFNNGSVIEWSSGEEKEEKKEESKNLE